MELIALWNTVSWIAIQEFSNILWDLKICYHVHKSPSLGQMNLVHIIPSYLRSILIFNAFVSQIFGHCKVYYHNISFILSFKIVGLRCFPHLLWHWNLATEFLCGIQVIYQIFFVVLHRSSLSFYQFHPLMGHEHSKQ